MARVVLFGGTGMVGQGVLRELLLDPGIAAVLTINRRSTGKQGAKLREVVLPDPSQLGPVKPDMKSVDACLYCVGTSALGMTEQGYTAVTKTMTLKVVDELLAANPKMRMLYVSGYGTDAKSTTMWARVKGETENEILARCPEAVMFRPGGIEPLHGIQGVQTLPYRIMYGVAPLLRLLPFVPLTTTEAVGRAMAWVAQRGSEKRILSNDDINRLARQHEAAQAP